jgi:putative aldouronate transport system permease protein
LVKEPLQDRILTVLFTAGLAVFLVLVAYPLIYVVSASLSDPFAEQKLWLWPVKPTFLAYEVCFRYPRLWTGYANSVFYAAAGTLLNVALTVLAAYPLSRREFPLRGPIMFLFSFTMWFSGGLIPAYLLVKNLGMLDTRAAMIIPGALSVWNMIITRTYFQANIPEELHDAARVDGCDDMTFLRRIVLSLSKPILAVITLFYAVGHWNAYFSALMYLSRRDLQPLQIVLREILIMNQTQEAMVRAGELVDFSQAERVQRLSELLKYSTIVVSLVPVIAVYPFIQKYFVRGVMIGALKG